MQLRSEDYESEYPLHHAIANRDIDEALLLLKDNNYVDQKDEGLYSPIFNAIVFDIESVVFRMVELGADLAIQNPYGDTPLHIATKYENLKYMELFIRKGAPINMKNYLGQSPLFKAVNSNNLIVADYLVQSGANLKLKNRYGLDVYDVAAELDNLNFLKKYKFPKDTSVNELDTQSSLLHIAIENDSMEVANYLIDHGDIEPLDEKQNTPLFTAVFKNNIGIVEKLLKNGVNVNHKNKYNRTPLFYTYTNTRSAIVELLVYHGAEIDVQDKYGFTPLLLNASYSNIVTTKSILEHNANPMIKNKKGKSIFDLKYHPKTINFDEMHKYSFDKDLSDPKPIRLPRILHMDIELIELISNLR